MFYDGSRTDAERKREQYRDALMTDLYLREISKAVLPLPGIFHISRSRSGVFQAGGGLPLPASGLYGI